MSNEEAGYATARRTPRQGMGGSPVGSSLSVILALIAVIAGFLILRSITDDGDSTAGDSGLEVAGEEETAGDDITDVTVAEVATTTTTTEPPRVTDGASVVVANANTVSGSAGAMTRSLELEGYSTEEAVNASGANIAASLVYYDPVIEGAQAVAESVARDLGDVDVDVVASPAPTASGDLGAAGVLVLLGDDEAGQTIEELSGGDDTGAASAEVPEPSDGDAVTDDATTDE